MSVESQAESTKIVALEQRIDQLEQRFDILVRRVNNMSDRLTALETRRHEERLEPSDNS